MKSIDFLDDLKLSLTLLSSELVFCFFRAITAQSVGPKNLTGDLHSKLRLEIEISFCFNCFINSDTFSTKYTNFLFRFRKNKHVQLFSLDSCEVDLRQVYLPLSEVSITSLERPIRPALISGFCSMKRLGVFLLPGWDASPSQGLPPAFSPVPIYTPGWREAP